MRNLGIFLSLALVLGLSSRSNAANATWAEEMYGLPGAQWGKHDDFQNADFKNNLVQIDQAGDGVWKHPETAYAAAEQGMALVVTNDNPLNAVPGMAGPGLAQYTAELRFKIVSELPAGSAGVGNDSLWWNVGGNWFTQVDSGPDIRMFEGKYTGGVFHQSRSGEGTQGSELNNGNFDGDPGIPASSRGQWHFFRMIQDEVAGTQRVYIDGNLLYSFDISAYNRAFPFTRSTAFGFYNHPDNSVPHAEVHYDYFRIANGVVEPGTAIDAVPEPASALLAMAVAGLGLAARRRA